MKIIGNGGNRNFIIEATGSELSQIMGPGYEHIVREENPNVFAVGNIIPISEMWKRLSNLSRIQRTLSGISKEMRGVADWLETVPAIIEPGPPDKKPKKSSA